MKNGMTSLVRLAALLFVLSLLLFFVFYVIPGDPVTVMLGPNARPEQIEAVRNELGLDRSLPRQYFRNIFGLFDRENPTMSYRFRRPVAELIGSALPLSLLLTAFSFAIALIISFFAAMSAAGRPGSIADRCLTGSFRIFAAIPPFFLAILTGMLFVFGFGMTGILDRTPQSGGAGLLSALWLPALAAGFPTAAQIYPFLRNELESEQRRPYVAAARSRGASSRRVLWRHLPRNAAAPYIAAAALSFAQLLLGTLAVEQVFSLPGLGRLLFGAVTNRDFPLAQAIILLLATSIVTAQALAEALARRIDPRTQKEGDDA